MHPLALLLPGIDTIVTTDVCASFKGDGCDAVDACAVFVTNTTRVTSWGGVRWWGLLWVAIDSVLLYVVVGGCVDSESVVEEVLEFIVSIIE